MRIKISSLILVFCLILGSLFVLSSCIMNESVGIVDAKINKDGELVLFYSNGDSQNVGSVVGENGADGKDGSDGKDGVDGSYGSDGGDNASSQIIINGESSIAAASAKGLRSAVSISCVYRSMSSQSGRYPGSGGGTSSEYSASGSGVIYKLNKSSGDAFIITNYHVVYDSNSNTSNGISDDISVYLYGSETAEQAIKATYVGGSPYYDIAVIRVDDSEILKNSNATQIEVCDSDTVVVGNSAIAIGNAQGYGISASFGIVSVDSEYITMSSVDGKSEVSFRVMRIDTAVNSGNSGGGLFDDKGRLIGIVNAKIVEDGVENIGYAIPSNVAVSIAENIIDYCYGKSVERVQRAILGIKVISSDSSAVFDSQTGLISIKETVSVYEVTKNSLADGVLQTGDVLVSATLKGDTTVIARQYHIIDMMLDVRAGDTVTLNIIRGEEEKTVSIIITENCLTEY